MAGWLAGWLDWLALLAAWVTWLALLAGYLCWPGQLAWLRRSCWQAHYATYLLTYILMGWHDNGIRKNMWQAGRAEF